MKSNIEITPFSPLLAKYFSEFNMAWLQKYFVVEPIDNKMLSNPKSFFIDKGGYIFLQNQMKKLLVVLQ